MSDTKEDDVSTSPAPVVASKKVLATRIQGTVKWFNVKNGYGFINRNDNKEDIFVHQTAIKKNNPKKFVRSVGDGEVVEFDVVVGEKGNEAANVTGPNNTSVKGSPYAADRNRFRGRWFPRRRYVPRQSRQAQTSGGDDSQSQDVDDDQRPRPLSRPTRRPFYRRYYRGPTRGPPRNLEQDGNEESENHQNEDNKNGISRGGGGNRRAPRRFYRRYFRRRPGRPRSDTEGSQSGMEGDGNKENEENGIEERQHRGQGRRPRPPYRSRQNRQRPRRGPPRPRARSTELAASSRNVVNDASAGDIGVRSSVTADGESRNGDFAETPNCTIMNENSPSSMPQSSGAGEPNPSSPKASEDYPNEKPSADQPAVKCERSASPVDQAPNEATVSA